MYISEITFILGNGFDLACGLKTSYSDIYAGYIKKDVSLSKVLEVFQRELLAHTENKSKSTWSRWSDFEMGLADYAKELSSEKDLLECLEDFTRFLQEHLSREEDSFIKQLNKYADWKRNVLFEVEDSFMSFYNKLPENNSIHFFDAASTTPVLRYNFLTFNYTRILDNLIGEINRMDQEKKSGTKYCAPLHIHGTLSNGLTLGVDNLSQLSGLNYSLSEIGKRALIKPYFNAVFDSDRVSQGVETIRNSDLICAYGLSLGESDLTWRSAVKQWIQMSPDHHLVFYSHKYSKKTDLTAWRKTSEEDNAKIEILILLGFDSGDYEYYLKQIHIPVGESIFNVAKIKRKITQGSYVAHPPAYSN